MIKKIKQLSFLGLLLLCSNVYSQTSAQRKADQQYDQLAYVDAIKVYEKIANKGHVNTDILSKLGDAYYFNGKLNEANKWYADLIESDYQDKDLSQISSEYYYRYAQTLRSIEDYEKASQIMQEFANREQSDSRVLLFEANKDYLQQIENGYERYEIKNLDINSPYSDFGAALLEDKLVFTSARNTQEVGTRKIHSWTNESFTSLYETQITSDGNFSEPTILGKEVDSKVNDASAVFTKEGTTMYFTRNNSKTSGKKKLNRSKSSLLKLYKATLSASGMWDEVVELPFNSDNFNTAHPALSPDGKWLYFTSDRKGTLGSSDIFRVEILPNNQYGEVINIGENVNTSGRETFPFISSDNYLFFASDGHPGLGGLDVFASKINADGSLEKPVNLGSPINTPADDFSFYIDVVTQKGFVSSNRAGGHGGDDIYFFKEKACTTWIEGVLTDLKTNEVLVDALVIITSVDKQQVDSIYTDQSGYYKSSAIACLGQYRIQGQKKDYSTVEVLASLKGEPTQTKVDLALEKSTLSFGPNDDLFKKLNLQPIYFDFDKSNIRQDAAIELAKVVEVMKEYPTMIIDVRSHTDSRGNDQYNMSLSDRRVKSTIKWMIEQGISKERLSGKGYGESQLINNCSNGVPCTIEQHQLNRRSEFIILSM